MLLVAPDSERFVVVVVRFGPKYKQWNAAFDAGIASALGKPLIVVHPPEHQHALKEMMELLEARDLTARVVGDYKGDHAKIKNSLNSTAEALHDAMVQVAEASASVATAPCVRSPLCWLSPAWLPCAAG